MRNYLGLAASLLLPLGAILPSAKAFQVGPPTDAFTLAINGITDDDGAGYLTLNPTSNQWSSDPVGGFNSTLLPFGTFFDTNDPLEILLTLSTPLTLGDNINYGFGLIEPAVDPTDFLFNFSITLENNGSPISNPFGFALYNPFNFPTGDVTTGTSTTITGGTFNQIDIWVTGDPSLAPADPLVSAFSVDVGNVPDSGTTLGLLAFGLACLTIFGRRSAVFAGRS